MSLKAFQISFIFTIFLYLFLILGPVSAIYYRNSICEYPPNEKNNFQIIIFSLTIISLIFFLAFYFEINSIKAILFYLFVASGPVILSYRNTTICVEDQCKKDLKNLLIAGVVLSSLSFMYMTYNSYSYIKNYSYTQY